MYFTNPASNESAYHLNHFVKYCFFCSPSDRCPCKCDALLADYLDHRYHYLQNFIGYNCNNCDARMKLPQN